MSREARWTTSSRTIRCTCASFSFAALAVWSAVTEARTFTTSADFATGTLVQVTDAAPDQLQLDARSVRIAVLWIPASSRGTLLRLDPSTGTILGEYRTAPQGRGLDPSRTAVDARGNVWTGNRAEAGDGRGSVVQVGLVAGGTRVRRNADGSIVPDAAGGFVAPPYDYCTCIDRNDDGLIRTSIGRGDILAWPDVHDGAADGDATVVDAEDECIRLYQRTSAPRTHQVSIAPSGDLWAGSFPGAVFDRLDGTTGQVLQTMSLPNGGHGGIVDSRGVLWSSGYDRNVLVRWDPATSASMSTPVLWSFGVAEDLQGNIWNTMWTNNTTAKFSGDGAPVAGFPHATFGGSAAGVAVTSDGDVWVAHASTNTVNRLTPAGALRKRVTVAAGPQGLAVDSDGKLWVVNRSANSAQRIDPSAGTDGLGAVERTVALGSGAVPQAYGNMTGLFDGEVLAESGSWTVVCDGAHADAAWSQVSWTSDEPVGTSLEIRVRAANAEADLASRAWVAAANGEALAPGSATGRFLQVQVAFTRDTAVAASPVLYDLTVNDNRAPDVSAAHPSVTLVWPPDHRAVPVEILGVTDPDGDPVVCTIVRITQDEAVSGRGAGHTAPDAGGVGTTAAWVRAERSGHAHGFENGRVYEIHFRASDSKGGVTDGRVQVCVPHDRGYGGGCADNGQKYDATVGPRLEAWQYPNPFNPSATIAYVLPADAAVQITIYDAMGRQVRDLAHGMQAAGERQVTWDGRDSTGRPVASGVYVYRLDAGGARQQGRMLLVK